MKSVIIKVLFFMALFYAADFVAGMVIGHFYGTSKNINLRDTNYGFSGNVQDDILIFGASELSHALISNRIIEKTGLSTYNLACDACGIYYQYPMLESILEAHVPKVIVISSGQMNEEDLSYISKLYPFYDDNKYVKNIVDTLQPREHLKLELQGYVYNSKLIRVFDRSNDNSNGYVPLPPEDSKIGEVDKDRMRQGKNYLKTENQSNYFRKFVQKAKRNGIKVYVCVPPILEKIDEGYQNRMVSIVKDSGAKIIDFSKDSTLIHHGEYFFDYSHLNHHGAEVMTDKVLEILKEDGVY